MENVATVIILYTWAMGIILFYMTWKYMKNHVIVLKQPTWKFRIVRNKERELTLISFYKWIYYSNPDAMIKLLDDFDKQQKNERRNHSEIN